MTAVSRGVLIRLFLVEGVPDGLWVVEKSNWTGVGLMCPRSSYPQARSREELTRPGVYVLVGPSESLRADSHLRRRGGRAIQATRPAPQGQGVLDSRNCIHEQRPEPEQGARPLP